MKILGISGFYHDSAASLVVDGNIVGAAQEERFTRIKHDSSFPSNAIEYLLSSTNLKLSEIDKIIFYEKPFLKFERLIETYLHYWPRGFRSFAKSMPIWTKEKLFQRTLLMNELKKIDSSFTNKNKLFFSEHHLSHAASAYYPSPFNEAVILTLDGVGEWATTSVCIGRQNEIKIIKELHFPNSLGLLYSAFTYFCGFKVNSGEYKLMGLAPYGVPKYKELILDNIVDVKQDGSFMLNMDYFDYATGLKMTSKKFNALFNMDPRNPSENDLTQFHMDMAASIQKVTEEILIKIIKDLRSQFDIPNLCLAGGVALNCVANGVIEKSKIYENIYIQPAAGDAGGALGAALAAWFNDNKISKRPLDDSMNGSYLGPIFSNEEIKNQLDEMNCVYHLLSDDNLYDKVSNEIIDGKAVGWFQGRAEFGPRALGNRSILADPRSKNMQKKLNLKVKFRESFRPFAPAILEEKLTEWFDTDTISPYMLLVSEIKKDKQIKLNDKEIELFGIEKLNIPKSNIPAVTHVDYSARIQTVHENSNPKYYKLISKFKQITGLSLIHI